MIKNLIYYLPILLIFLSCSANNKIIGENTHPDSSILEFTENGLEVYLVMNEESGEEGVTKYLISNDNLYWKVFPKLDFETSFAKKLNSFFKCNRNINCLDISNRDFLDNYLVDKAQIKRLQALTIKEVYDKYFGIKAQNLKINYPKNEIKAAVTILIEHGTMVHKNADSLYDIYVLPAGTTGNN